MQRVYSYLRFSDPKQSQGGSADRQIEYARRWATEHGLRLDESLSMRDEGLSAYHQKHVTHGALGVFLTAIDDGRVPQGSVLIVEGLDRLSRAEPIQAQAQLAQIINAGITVVTASDGREYNRQTLKAQPMDLVYSLLVMIRAHEESDTKSKRVSAAIRRQCEGWLSGTYRGPIRNGKDPSWVVWEKGSASPVPERVEAIRSAVAMFMDGYGAQEIMRRLRPASIASAASHLYKLFRNRALVGEKVLTVAGVEYRLPGYYPKLLEEDEFNELQRHLSQRRRRKGRGEIPGVITGMGICRCGYCGSAMVAQNLMQRRRRSDGLLHEGHRRLICVSTSHAQACPVNGSCSVVPVEHAIMDYCADQMNLQALFNERTRGSTVHADIAKARTRAAEIESQLERLTEALLSSSEPVPITFARKATLLERELGGLQEQIHHSELELVAQARQAAPDAAALWAALVTGVKTIDYEARMKARRLVADTFARIVVFHSGTNPQSEGRTIDVLLEARGGVRRLIRIDRRSGSWAALY